MAFAQPASAPNTPGHVSCAHLGTPDNYMNSPIIANAMIILEFGHSQSDVDRVAGLLIQHYFRTGFVQVSKPWLGRGNSQGRPSKVVENYKGNVIFMVHCVVEVKRGSSDSLQKVFDAGECALVELAKTAENGRFWRVVIRGKKIAFFVYHDNKKDLLNRNVKHHFGCLAFNDPQGPADGRPHYEGGGKLKYTREAEERSEWGIMVGMELNLRDDADKVGAVLDWMAKHEPTSI